MIILDDIEYIHHFNNLKGLHKIDIILNESSYPNVFIYNYCKPIGTISDYYKTMIESK